MFDFMPIHNKEDFDNICKKYHGLRPSPAYPAWGIMHMHYFKQEDKEHIEKGACAAYEFIYFNSTDIVKEFNIELGVYN